MCTVTYVPGKGGFFLTSNRDEHITRGIALAPAIYNTGNAKLLYPKDPDKHGSWIAAKNNGDLVVLLNGAFVKHARQENYSKSRGIVLKEIIEAESPVYHYNTIDLNGVEPFTLILYNSGELYECRWDGEEKYMTSISTNEAHIWSSATLYDQMAAGKRENWFNDWQRSDYPKTTNGILHFHKHAGEGDERDGLIINRDGKMKTMSVTNISVMHGNITMTYEDLKANKQYIKDLAIESPMKTGLAPRLPRFFAIKRFFIRLFNWEYWSLNSVYAPILFYWLWLSFKSRSFFFFNAANPQIENGGFAMESKWLIHHQIPKLYKPETFFFKAGTSVAQIKQVIQQENLNYPLILKPDIGGRGILVKKIHNDPELTKYVQSMKVDFLVQAFIAYKHEVGIFYYRIPGEDKGHISGVVGKEFLTVMGNGRLTIAELLAKEPRYLLQLPELMITHATELQDVLPSGEKRVLVPYGNHVRGAKFIDLGHLISDELTQTIDAVCRQIPEFYFGRMDVMYNTWEELCQGKNFAIVELNGAGSEPTHIYDPKHSIFFAWQEIIRHWKFLHHISTINHKNKNLKYMTYAEGMQMLKENTNYLKLIA
ncbi:NRDE family protein [Mucilaginibacter sp. RCC_168]|uniref:NRDE family protein n=1 Tax=Mucilaginibacter sp. RCC_168 TaxID=3239221 RepID=UPI0035259FB9